MPNPSTLKSGTYIQSNPSREDEDDMPPALPPRPKFSM